MKKLISLTAILILLISGSVRALDSNFWYFTKGDTPNNWQWVISDPSNWWMPLDANTGTSASGKLSIKPSEDQTIAGAVKLEWNKKSNWAGIGIVGENANLAPYEKTGKLVLALKVEKGIPRGIEIKMHCGDDCSATLDISKHLRKAAKNTWFALPIPLDCFSEQGVDLSKINKPFEIGTTSKLTLHIGEISIQQMDETDQSCASS